MAIAATLATPIVTVLASLARPAWDVWAHLWQTQLAELLASTVLLLAAVGAGTLALGTLLAWLVVHHEFPGRRHFEWALVLPLAMPAYVIGFTFLGIFEFAGPVQTALRGALGAGLRLPEPRSFPGVAACMVLVFYPYVYLLARAAFEGQSTAMLETARSLGRSRGRAFVEVTLPLARPWLAAGTALAMMEALADVGTVSTFGYRTLTEGVYRVWYGLFDRQAAAQLASVLLLVALGLLAVERLSRGRARFTRVQRGAGRVERVRLAGSRAAAAAAACGAVLGAAFLLPVGQLALWAGRSLAEGSLARGFGRLLATTLGLAGLAAAVTTALAVLLAYAVRLRPAPAVRHSARLASMGYALPGSVIAVGVLLPLAWLDHAAADLVEALLGRPAGLWLTGSAAGLLFAYAVRFLAVSYQTVEAGLTAIAPSLDDAARSLGAGLGGTLRRVHLPLLRGGLATAVVLVFVETMKEMPATLLLRPFGLATLAVEVWERTSEAMWQEAAAPALAIVLAGLVPVVIAIRWSSRGPGGAPGPPR